MPRGFLLAAKPSGPRTVRIVVAVGEELVVKIYCCCPSSHSYFSLG